MSFGWLAFLEIHLVRICMACYTFSRADLFFSLLTRVGQCDHRVFLPVLKDQDQGMLTVVYPTVCLENLSSTFLAIFVFRVLETMENIHRLWFHNNYGSVKFYQNVLCCKQSNTRLWVTWKPLPIMYTELMLTLCGLVVMSNASSLGLTLWIVFL